MQYRQYSIMEEERAHTDDLLVEQGPLDVSVATDFPGIPGATIITPLARVHTAEHRGIVVGIPAVALGMRVPPGREGFTE